jgi:hypothetical protein
MPLGWRCAARSPGSPSRCGTESPGRRRAEVTRAFVDRAPIDWAALARRAADPGDRAVLDMLRRLDALRGPGRIADDPRPDFWDVLFAILVVAAGAQTTLGLVSIGAAAAAGAAPVSLAPHAGLAAVFAAASLLLGSAAPRDRRVFPLLTAFSLTAGAFARPLIAALPHPALAWWAAAFDGVYPEAFAPAALWRFAVVFPSVRRFTRFDQFARHAAAGAGLLGAALVLVNVLLAHGLAPALARFERNHPGDLFWQLFAWATLPVLGVIAVRAARAPWAERQKVARFAWSVGAGGAPLLALGLARSWPGLDAWMAAGGIGPWLDAGAMSALAAMPLLATAAVLMDGPFGDWAVIGPGADSRIARLSFRVRAWQTRRVWPRGHRDRLTAALERLRLARGARDVGAVLQRELQFGVGASTVVVAAPETLPAGSALLPILEAASGTIDLAPSTEPFTLLPRGDREWLAARAVTLAAALRLRDGRIAAVLLLGRPRREEWFDRADRWFITALLSAAAAAWETADERTAEPACGDECVACGRVRAAGAAPCCAGAAARAAALPVTLGGRFVVMRRLGAGGMGVVYLGRDLGLGRDVALKTLPRLSEGAMARLRDEARVMAALNHEAIATIYGVECWRGAPVLVMEYCPRGTLADALAHRPLRADEGLRLGVRLADALAYMHERGVLHRDVKPSNIAFTARGKPKLLDFGLSGEDERPAGTRGYLPPEALAGAPPDAAGDLWALATVLRLACAPDPRLDAVLDRALSMRPADRLATASALRDALARLRRVTP